MVSAISTNDSSILWCMAAYLRDLWYFLERLDDCSAVGGFLVSFYFPSLFSSECPPVPSITVTDSKHHLTQLYRFLCILTEGAHCQISSISFQKLFWHILSVPSGCCGACVFFRRSAWKGGQLYRTKLNVDPQVIWCAIIKLKFSLNYPT